MAQSSHGSYILDFLASDPSLEQIAAFQPRPETQARLHSLLERSRDGQLTEAEGHELEEYERIEHLMVMIKAKYLPPEGGLREAVIEDSKLTD
jgi:hypothetical protein